ncbi:MAG: class I SAM-dependent methyltransferase [Chloroflexota bacterium]
MNLKNLALDLYRTFKISRQAWRNRQDIQNAHQGKVFFQQEITWLLDCDEGWLQETAQEYRACEAAWKYLSGLRSPSRQTDGAAKSLDVAEGFVVWALVKHQKPEVVVELGVQHGISSRLWKEALKAYVPDHELILCDLEDRRQFIQDSECTFVQGDARQTLPEILRSRSVGVLHNDAHPYGLIRWSIQAALEQQVAVLTFHDVGRHHRRAPFRKGSFALSPVEKEQHAEDYSHYGCWERHVIAELFGQQILDEDAMVTGDHRVQIFDSLFGFGVVLQGAGHDR